MASETSSSEISSSQATQISNSTSSANPSQLPSLITVIPIVNPQLSIKLDDDNFLLWKNQMLNSIIAHGFDDFIDRFRPCPPRFLANQPGEVNPDYTVWQRSMMSKQELKSLFPIEDISVMGIWELLPHINKIRVKLKETVEAALLFQPHVVVTVDSKGFSFRLLKQLRARYNQQRVDVPVHFHYVAPSFWAWKGGEARLKGLASFVDHILCILPHEEEVCRASGLAATFVGHPTLEDVSELNSGRSSSLHELKIEGNSEDFKVKNAIAAGATVLSLLPGSRLQEVTRMLTIFANTMQLLQESFPELVTVIHVAPNRHVENYIDRVVCKWPVPAVLIPGGSPHLKYDALSASKVALCTSGTVAVEMQLARLPCVVAYRAHFLTEWFIRYKAKIPYISLPNILLNSAVIPEALFQACTHSKLAALLIELLRNDDRREEQIAAAEKVVRLLCPPERLLKNLVDSPVHSSSPSMLAAAVILYHERP